MLDTLTQCWLNVGLASATLAQHLTNIGSLYRVCWGPGRSGCAKSDCRHRRRQCRQKRQCNHGWLKVSPASIWWLNSLSRWTTWHESRASEEDAASGVNIPRPHITSWGVRSPHHHTVDTPRSKLKAESKLYPARPGSGGWSLRLTQGGGATDVY